MESWIDRRRKSMPASNKKEKENYFQKMSDELDKTAVISDSFKNKLLTLMSVGLEDAFQRGHDKGFQEGVSKANIPDN
jgi:flagellar biosynthesis/type III secretory pathway protein FliH